MARSIIELARLIARAEFRSFTESDWSGFAGAMSADPQIAGIDDKVIIIDGDQVVVIDGEDGDEETYVVTDQSEMVGWSLRHKQLR